MRDSAVVRKLMGCDIFINFQRAFRTVTRLTLSLEPANESQIPPVAGIAHNSFCGLLTTLRSTRDDWAELQKLLQQNASCAPATVCSRYGLSESAVPVKLGDRLIGYLHAGPVCFRRPTSVQIHNVVHQLRNLGVCGSTKDFIAAYRATPVVERRVYDAMIRLLEFFAAQLAAMANQILLQETNAVPGHIMRACEFIANHYDEELRLRSLAAHVGLSPFALCKHFKQATKITFKDYVARLRVEKAKGLLLNPKYQISEAAFNSGFQSLSNFNRHFKRIAGESPTQFRLRRKQLM